MATTCGERDSHHDQRVGTVGRIPVESDDFSYVHVFVRPSLSCHKTNAQVLRNSAFEAVQDSPPSAVEQRIARQVASDMRGAARPEGDRRPRLRPSHPGKQRQVAAHWWRSRCGASLLLKGVNYLLISSVTMW